MAEGLATSEAQISALVKRGDLPALELGGRGQWRIERSKLEDIDDGAGEGYAKDTEYRSRRAPSGARAAR